MIEIRSIDTQVIGPSPKEEDIMRRSLLAPIVLLGVVAVFEFPTDAAQGNATRLFFREQRPAWPRGWTRYHSKAFASFSYLLSGGFSKPAFYPAWFLPWLQRWDERLSRWPGLFGVRCLVGLRVD